MKCKICQSDSRTFAQATILNKYNITYFQCPNCRFVQTEEPYWLNEAYSSAIAPNDDGLVFRNLILSQITGKMINKFFNPNGKFLDYGGGYGLFVRLMRDIRFQFDWYDKFCQNLLAPEFPLQHQPYELVTAFELFEHLVNPLEEISNILKFSRNILFSTELLPPDNPQPEQWWYYALNQGQHISFFTPESLSIIAVKLNLNCYSNGSSLHLLTDKIITPEDFANTTQYHAEKMRNDLAKTRSYSQLFHQLASEKTLTFPGNESNNIELKNPVMGINIAGYVNGEFGIGEGVRANIRSIEAAQIPFVINNFTQSPHRKSDTTYQHFSDKNPYPINLIQVNADEVKNFIKVVGKDYLKGRYNIGFWAWELPHFPPQWAEAFSWFNEIWTYSNYCADAIAPISPIPVIKVMPSISLPLPEIDREALDLPKDKFIFLFIFDFLSRVERKNPEGVIAAFKQAFGAKPENVLLVIKSSNSQAFPQARSRLQELIESHPAIKQIEGYLSKAEINGLLYNCDCYVSLHRAEGFGLTMAEAMYYKKPVIATAYSSNQEFMNIGNSFLVNYDLQELETDYGPYKKGNIWANPHIDHAAYLMRYVFDNYEYSKQVGNKGGATIRTLLSPQVRGQQIQTRLQTIMNQINQTPTPQERVLFTIPQSSTPETPEKPLVSICIPTYNGEAFLEDAIASALAQTYPNLEIIISDDGSTDKTVEIAQNCLEKTTLNYRIILHQNYGLSQNWNFCISQAQGKYIKFLFQDDLLETNCIEKMVNLAEKDTKIGLVFSPRDIIIAQGEESNPLFQSAFRAIRELYKNWSNLKEIQGGRELLLDPNFLKNPLNKIGEPSTVLIRREIFNQIGLFDSSLSQLVDVDMWFRIMGNYKIGFICQQLSTLRIHSGQQTWKNFASGENKQDVGRLYGKMLNHSSYHFLPSEIQESLRDKLKFQGELSLSEILQSIGEYKKHPLNQSLVTKLQNLRQKFAVKCLNMTKIEEMEASYLGNFGKVYQCLLHSGIKDEILRDDEKAFMNKIRHDVSSINEIPLLIRYYLAFRLYGYAYQLPVLYQSAIIPKWYLEFFLNFLVEKPRFWQNQGESEKYFLYIKELIDYVYHQTIIIKESSPFWLDSAYKITQRINKISFLNNNFLLKDIFQKNSDILKNCLISQAGSLSVRDEIEEDLTTINLREKNPKIVLGILVDKISVFSETIATLSVLEGNHREIYGTINLYYSHIADDKLTEYCRNRVDNMVKLPANLSERVSLLRSHNLDILLIGAKLFSPEEGNQKMGELCLHRLARKQIILGTTNPVTTGIKNIDYYLGGTLTVATLEAEEDYGEKVIKLEGSGMCFNYAIPLSAPGVHPTRESWNASPESIVFMSMAKFDKIIPELRETWVKILASVPQSILVLCPFRLHKNYPTIAFLKEMRSRLREKGLKEKRLIVVQNLPGRADILECLKLADIYLDSFPYTGAASLIDPLIIGVPTVVREGESTRAKRGSAILRELQLPELITESENSYIDLSVALGTHPDLRQHYRQKIQQQIAQNPRFLDSYTYSQQIGIILSKIYNGDMG